jgi:hypothetical protein
LRARVAAASGTCGDDGHLRAAAAAPPEGLRHPVEKLTRDARLEDLEIDSLRMIEIIFRVEELFEITVPPSSRSSRRGCRPSAISRLHRSLVAPA